MALAPTLTRHTTGGNRLIRPREDNSTTMIRTHVHSRWKHNGNWRGRNRLLALLPRPPCTRLGTATATAATSSSPPPPLGHSAARQTRTFLTWLTHRVHSWAALARLTYTAASPTWWCSRYAFGAGGSFLSGPAANQPLPEPTGSHLCSPPLLLYFGQ